MHTRNPIQGLYTEISKEPQDFTVPLLIVFQERCQNGDLHERYNKSHSHAMVDNQCVGRIDTTRETTDKIASGKGVVHG